MLLGKIRSGQGGLGDGEKKRERVERIVTEVFDLLTPSL